MMVNVKLSLLLRKFTNGEETVQASGTTLEECLRDLETRYPGIGSWLYDKQGELKRQVWLFLNGERIHPEEITRPVRDGDELSVVLAIAGG